jgi:hypothetical protein
VHIKTGPRFEQVLLVGPFIPNHRQRSPYELPREEGGISMGKEMTRGACEVLTWARTTVARSKEPAEMTSHQRNTEAR